MKRNDTEIENRVAPYLELLRDAPEPDPQTTARTRIRYLNKARSFSVAVSPDVESRHIGWKVLVTQLISRKGDNPMLKPIFAVLVAVTLVFGSVAATAQAAQASLPNEALYPVKTLTEQIQYSLAFQEQARLKLLEAFSQERIQEMVQLHNYGLVIPEAVVYRLQQQLQQQLQLVAGLAEGEMQPALEQLRTWTRQMLQTMEQAELGNDPLMAQIRQQLQEQNRLCDLGLEDALQFRQQVQLQFQNQAQTKAQTGNQTQSQNQNQTQTQSQDQNQTQNQLQNQSQTQTQSQDQNQNQTQSQIGQPEQPQQGSGNGTSSGPGPIITVEPGNGYGINPTPGAGNGNNPSPAQGPSGSGGGGSGSSSGGSGVQQPGGSGGSQNSSGTGGTGTNPNQPGTSSSGSSQPPNGTGGSGSVNGKP